MFKKKKTVNPYSPEDKHPSNGILRGGSFRYTEQGKRSYVRTCCYIMHYSWSIGYRICLKKV